MGIKSIIIDRICGGEGIWAISMGSTGSRLMLYMTAQVIFIDEAQFFPDLQEFCCTAADDDDKLIIVAGLSGDFRRQKFGQVVLDICSNPKEVYRPS